MTTKTIDKPTQRLGAIPSVSVKRAKSNPAQTVTATKARKHEATPEHQSGQAPTTKHAQLLQLLNRPEGASLEELTRATNWQQHSVRGFLAGTVKKMGLALTSNKADGAPRRYRIAARRGR